jgi:hypothetical protein
VAKDASEVLVVQHIPADAIVDVKPPVAGQPKKAPPAGGC